MLATGHTPERYSRQWHQPVMPWVDPMGHQRQSWRVSLPVLSVLQEQVHQLLLTDRLQVSRLESNWYASPAQLLAMSEVSMPPSALPATLCQLSHTSQQGLCRLTERSSRCLWPCCSTSEAPRPPAQSHSRQALRSRSPASPRTLCKP